MATYPDFDPDALQIQPVALRTLAFPSHEAMWNVVAAGERMFALILLLALLPGLALAALAVVLLSRRCPLIAHARVGQGGKRLWVLKLRTMWGQAVPDHGRRSLFIERLKGAPAPDIKRSDDPRVTGAFAAACRKYSIDELPQLWHVVRGDLSLVGPRPMTVEELAEHYGSAGAEVLRLKPGLTGLWQVRGRSALNYRQRRRLDLLLARRWSLRLYFAILLATVPQVLTGKNAW